MTDLENYIRYKRGAIPLIISVPHGGSLECETIPKRKSGILGIDKGTIELADKLIASTNKPSYIISNVRRSKIDMNREEKSAYSKCSNLAKELYQFFHNKIKELIDYNIICRNE